MKRTFSIDQRNEKLRIVEWSIELMHQTETKSLSVIGFYMAFAGLLIGFLLSEPPCFQATLAVFFLFALGGWAISILSGYRDWKRHYLHTVQSNLKELEIPNLTLPTSLRYDPSKRERIYIDSLDRIALTIPFLFLAIAVSFWLNQYASEFIELFLGLFASSAFSSM